VGWATRRGVRCARSDPDLRADSQIAILALVGALRGDEAAARDRVRLASCAGRHSFGHHHHAQYEVAGALAHLGDAEAGLDWLEAAASNGYPCLALFESDALLAPLRSHERYRSLVARIRDSQRVIVEFVGAFDRGAEA